jgi:dynein heavy chain
VKTEETTRLLHQLAIEQAEVVRVRSRVEVEELAVKRKTEAVAAMQADARSEVDAAMPILEGALRALDALDKKARARYVSRLCDCDRKRRSLRTVMVLLLTVHSPPSLLQDLAEVRAFPQPPLAVRTVMEAVCTLLGEPTDWDSARRLLASATFVNSLIKFEKDSVPDAILKRLSRCASLLTTVHAVPLL